MDVDSSLNDSVIIKRRSCRGRPPSVKRESEAQEPVNSREQSDEDTGVPRKLAGRKRKRKRSSGSGAVMKRSRLGKHHMSSYVRKPLRRSQREKRLLFATFNVSQMDKQILSRADTDISEEEMDPYEKLLSPHRVTRTSSRLGRNNPPSVASGSSTKMAAAKKEESSGEEGGEGAEEEEGEEGEVSEGQGEEASGEQTEGEQTEGEQTEDEGGFYNLRKRQPVIYHLKPVHHVVEDDTPPKKRRGRRRRRSLSRHYHSKARAAAPRAYQGSRKSGLSGGQSPRKKQAHHDSSSTSSDSDSDEAKFRRRKARSMTKARSQCLPMNFTTDDMAQGVIRDRIQIGSSLADVNPMNVDRSVTFDSIGGLKQHIRALKEMIIFPLLYPEVFERFQINPPRGVLFHGPPGCGKTLVARALANECSKGGKKVAFFMRKGADCLSKWVGESERQLRLLFDQAYQVRPSIIFFDEIDGLAPVRSSRQDQIHSSIVSTILALMDGLDSRGEIVVIGATNRIDAIDPALRRPGRFDREFIFPLPSREDRHSILSIHTQGWNPKLKDTFLSELSNNTVGYCGADLRALCTEAALFALRRKYPQIYSTSEKLVLDTSKINVAASDFHNALKSIIPTAQRSDTSMALALPEHVRPLYLNFLGDLLNLLSFVFPPCWKLVTRASKGLEMLLSTELETTRKMEGRIKELKESHSTLAKSKWAIESATAESRDATIVAAHSKKASSLLAEKRVRSKSRSNSGDGTPAAHHHPLSNKHHSSIGNWSGDVSNHRSLVDQLRHNLSSPSGSTEGVTKCVAASSVYNQLFLKHSKSLNLGSIFFDLAEVSSEDDVAAPSSSILMDSSSGNPSSEEVRGAQSSSLHSSSYLSFSSHPHAPPSVHQPRLVLCGQPGMGQSSYLGPALLHALEDLPVRSMDLTALFGSSTKTPEEACAQVLRELKRVTPSVLYLPRLDSWWNVTSETFQITLFSALSSLLPSTPLLVLATAECQWEQLPDKLKEVFADVGSQTFTVLCPTVEQRRQFFYEVLLEKPFHPPPTKPKLLTDMLVEDLPVAAPPKPRELNKDEVGRIVRQREAVLRELRVFLRDATNKLLAERKFKEFVKPVDPEEVPDYHDIIAEPMDLSTIMKKIDEHRYTFPKQWVQDVDLIAKNALEYNPECDSESRLLRHRAVALQDMAHSFLDHELSEEFEQQCENIAESFERIEKTEAYAQFMLTSSVSSTPKYKDAGAMSSDNFKSDLYNAPRRSLRQKGMGPEAEGFPYYSPSKSRIISELESSQKTGDISAVSPDAKGSGRNTGESSDEKAEDRDSIHNGVRRVSMNKDSQDDKHGQRGLTNSNVRRQIIRPWEDPAMKDCGGQNGLVTPPESSLESELSMSYKGTQKRTNSVQTAAEALVAMATPSKDPQEEPMVVSSDGNHSRSASKSPPKSAASRKRSVSLARGDVCNGVRGASHSPPAATRQTQVSIDSKSLLELFERIVSGTENCSVEEMERIHTTYRQLVFRHRMSWERQSLVEDLRLTTDLFLRELVG